MHQKELVSYGQTITQSRAKLKSKKVQIVEAQANLVS